MYNGSVRFSKKARKLLEKRDVELAVVRFIVENGSKIDKGEPVAVPGTSITIQLVRC